MAKSNLFFFSGYLYHPLRDTQGYLDLYNLVHYDNSIVCVFLRQEVVCPETDLEQASRSLWTGSFTICEMEEDHNAVIHATHFVPPNVIVPTDVKPEPTADAEPEPSLMPGSDKSD